MKIFLRTLFLALALVTVVLLAGRFGPRFDLTREREHSLAPRSAEVLNSLAEDVEVTAFYRPEDPETESMRGLLRKYDAASPRFRYSIIDPDRNPGKAKALGVRSYGTTVVSAGARSTTVYSRGEEDLTSAILRVAGGEERGVSFLAGHGEKSHHDAGEDGYSEVAKILIADGIPVDTIFLVAREEIPATTGVVIVAGPVYPMLPNEVNLLESYIRDGGSVILLCDPESALELNELPGRFGLEARGDVVVDRGSRLYGADMQMPAATAYERHDATRGLRGASFFPRACTVGRSVAESEGAGFRPLVRSGPEAWAEREMDLLDRGKAVFDAEEDQRGPVVIGGVLTLSSGGNLILFGDSDFASNRFRSLGANGALFLNVVSWAVGQTGSLGIREQDPGSEPLFLSMRAGRLLFWLPVVVVPLAVILTGIFVVLGWRRRS